MLECAIGFGILTFLCLLVWVILLVMKHTHHHSHNKDFASGDISVNEDGEAHVRLTFQPCHLEAHFSDKLPPKPGCCPSDEDWVKIHHHHNVIHLTWHVNEPRKIRWFARK